MTRPPSKPVKSRVARSSIIGFAASLISFVAGFVLLRVMVERLGIEQFGLFSMVSIFSVTGFLFLLEMGFQSSVIKYTAQFQAEDNWPKIEQLASSVTGVFFGVGIATAAIGLIAAPWLTTFFTVPKEFESTLTLAFRITFSTYLFSFPALIGTGVMQGLQAFSQQKSIDTTFSVLRACGSIGLLYAGYGFLAIVIFVAVLQVMQCLIIYYYLIFARHIRIGPSKFSMTLIREIREMTTIVFIGRLSSFAFTQTDRLVISHFLGSAALGVYETAIKIPFGIKSIMSQLNMVLMPASSYRHARAESGSPLRTLFLKGFEFQIFFTFPVMIAAFVFAEPTMRLWLGNATDETAILMRWAMFIPILSSLLSIGSSILLGANLQLRRLTALVFISALVNVVLDVALAPSFGLKGIIAATIFGTLVVVPSHANLFAKEFSLSRLRMLKVPGVAAAVGMIIFFISKWFDLPTLIQGWTSLVIGGSMVGMLTAAGIFFFGLDQEGQLYLTRTFLRRRKN